MRQLVAVIVVVVPAVAVADPFPWHIDPVLVGAFGGGHGRGGRAPHGWFLGADTGHAWFIGMSDVAAARATSTPSDSGWCFGARAGYQLPSGLAVQARFDKLGVDAPDGTGALDAVSGGIRYSLPMVPMPFAEAAIGATFTGQDVAASAGIGVGLSLLPARHVSFDA
ncbi:MAG TPA: hypothetical protein VLT45_15590, partial [Kofleriaceae bacterium]|nr:hypothetical protein [Kofleriaceae bacterium]